MIAKFKIKNHQDLYESDYLQWLEQTIRRLQYRQIDNLDRPHFVVAVTNTEF
jgi:hypothetical protein